MTKGNNNMKCLMIKNGKGYLKHNTGDIELDKISKENLKWMIEQILNNTDEEFSMDNLSECKIHNKAHEIIYRNLEEKFRQLINDRNRIFDECNNQFEAAFKKYE